MFALVIVFVVLVLSFQPFVFPDLLNPGSSANLIALVLVNLTYFLTLIPISVAFAVLRYRLWDIDLIIRRTLAYGAITTILTLVYLGGITVFQKIFTLLTGQISPLAVVLSTLMIAALFTPLRRRVQAFIDRRFFRNQYNAEHAMARFSQILRAQVDLHSIQSELVGVVTETIQPVKVTLWIREVKVK